MSGRDNLRQFLVDSIAWGMLFASVKGKRPITGTQYVILNFL